MTTVDLELERRRLELLLWDGKILEAQEQSDGYIFKVKIPKKPKQVLTK